ncbi:MAG TPA: DNA polymerase domain-containing protein, partial [Polyangiaceae bacterium]|nr:DNA polymerase domain-containing protein [Polyangiaceae bacterium]
FAEPDGRVLVWRRLDSDQLTREEARFRPWLLLSTLEYLEHLGPRLRAEQNNQHPRAITYRELSGTGALRFLVQAPNARELSSAVLEGVRKRTGQVPRRVNDLGESVVLSLSLEEQYLVSSGRSYFRDLEWNALRRLQFDLETTGLDAERDHIFLIAVRAPNGETFVLELEATDADRDAAEAAIIRRLLGLVQEFDPDVIENHNLFGFDLPFLVERARRLRVPLNLGRYGQPGLRLRAAGTGRGVVRTNERFAAQDSDAARPRRMRYTTPGREFIDTLDAVRRYDFSARDLPGHGLKAVAKKLGVSGPDREYIPGDAVYRVYQTDPDRVRRYASQDVIEAARVSHVLGAAAFALARMAPRRYERVADAGAATGLLDPMIVRAYLRSNAALPAHAVGDGVVHTGAALYLFATGVAQRIVKADVASLYPSLMRQYRIGPANDRLGVLLALVDRLVEQRLAAKQRARSLPANSAERATTEALSAAMKIVINSAYGYLGAVGLTRFADVRAANEVTRHGRELLAIICRELDRRGVTLLEADTDGVYFAMPEGSSETNERQIVSEVAALLPELVHLEFEGRYAAMLSHEPKNYALKPYQGPVLLRGVAFRSRRAEPFGEAFLGRAIDALLSGDVPGVRRAYVESVISLRARAVPTSQLTVLARLTKSPDQYLASRKQRRESVYEALVLSGRGHWEVGEVVRVYRAQGGRPSLWNPRGSSEAPELAQDPRDYDVEYYVSCLRANFASRLERALEPEHFALAFADPQQLPLFTRLLETARPLLTRRALGETMA